MTPQLSYPVLKQAFARFAESEPHPKGELHHTNAFTLLVNNCICCDRCLTCLTVTNNKLSLSTSYREH